MTVEKLIQLLQAMPRDWEVIAAYEDERRDSHFGILAVRRDTQCKDVVLELENYD